MAQTDAMDRRVIRAAVLAAAVALPGSAQAATALGALPLALAAAASFEQGQCASAALPASGAPAPIESAALSKASAILGGQVSQLELLKQQQAGLAVAKPALPGAGLVPRSGGECAMFVRPAVALAAMRPGLGASALGDGDFLASKRLPVKKTSFDAQWNRVRRDTLPAALTRSLAGVSAGKPNAAALAAVNSWANTRIRYVEDRELYGQPDYWADAKATLRRGAGDCEDIAIAKMALLAGMGVPREDMFLTVARDLARNADHALLVVRAEGRMWLLDNNTDRLLDAKAANDYRPILSYSAGGKWLHGY